MKYDIIKTEGADAMGNMIKMVNIMIKNGWTPLGGISVYDYFHGKVYHQAIKKGTEAP